MVWRTHDVPVLLWWISAVHDGVNGDLISGFAQYEQCDDTQSQCKILRHILTLS